MPAVPALLHPGGLPTARQDPGLAGQRGQARLAAAQGAGDQLRRTGDAVNHCTPVKKTEL